ncbi:MAG: hypothetical protein ACLFRI_07795 [Candidatus Izemoplasmataceae bacterium]
MLKKPWNSDGELLIIESFKWVLLTAFSMVVFSTFFNHSLSLYQVAPVLSFTVISTLLVHLLFLNSLLFIEIMHLLHLKLIQLIKQKIVLNIDTTPKLIIHYINHLPNKENEYLKLCIFRI